MKHELRQMRRQGYGCIVNTSSDAGLGAMANFGGYCPSKAGNNMLSVCAAIENSDMGIRVNVVCPGPTANTALFDRLRSSAPEGALPSSVNDLDDVTRVVLWLCSDESSRVNGSVIPVGGRLGVPPIQ
jgi:NAD(P)-dependent dehydrogenase (short-subunit alcohol dehydrogenase family)